MKAETMVRTRARIASTTAFAAAVCLGGCSQDRLTSLGERGIALPTSVVIVSNPVATPGAALQTSGNTAAVARGATGLVYVSFAPATIERGSQVEIRNATTGFTRIAPVVAGGMDPVGIPANVGDRLDLTVTDGPQVTAHVSVVVAARRPPRIVRTNPPHKKRDVPLNARMQIVFSEPIDVATLTPSSVQLVRDGQAVAGRLAFIDALQLAAEFVPTGPLAPGADYELLVTAAIRDQQGEALEAPVSVTFTTQYETPVTVGAIAFTRITVRGAVAWTSEVFTYGGGTETSLLRHPYWPLEAPEWSPNGAQMVVDVVYGTLADDGRGGPERASDVFVVQVDALPAATAWRPLTRDGQSRSPSWSPDGRRIAYVGGLPSHSHIYVVNAAGGPSTRVSAVEGHYSTPRWSPDGNRIAFTDTRDWDSDVFVMNADGSGVVNISQHPAHDYSPSWSPDGRRLAFDSERDGRFSNIYTVELASGRLTRLTNNSAGEWSGGAIWSPDGRQILFSFLTFANDWNPDGRSGLYVMNADGSFMTRLTQAPFGAGDTSPTWKR